MKTGAESAIRRNEGDGAYASPASLLKLFHPGNQYTIWYSFCTNQINTTLTR